MKIPLADALAILAKLPIVDEYKVGKVVMQERYVGPHNLVSKHLAFGLQDALTDDKNSPSVAGEHIEGFTFTSRRERL